MISHKYKCIFIHIPKCAGTSIEIALGHAQAIGRGMQDHRALRQLIRPIPISALTSLENLRLLKILLYRQKTPNPNNHVYPKCNQYRNYFKFTIVRNPWARVHSAYKNLASDPHHRRRYRIPEGMPFDEFLPRHIGEGMLKRQTYWIQDFDGRIGLDFVGRFENLNEDFAHACQEMGVEPIPLPHEIRSPNPTHYRDAYSPELRDMVARFYRQEIELFGYEW